MACCTPAPLAARQADVSVAAWVEPETTTDRFVIEARNATAEELCMLSLTPMARDAVRERSVGYIWAASRGVNARWGSVREGPVPVKAIPPGGVRRMEMRAHFDQRDVAALDWA